MLSPNRLSARPRPASGLRRALQTLRSGLRAALPMGVSLLPSLAFAHGEPPTAHAVVASDGQVPEVVSLNKGFAKRLASGRFEFLCPAAWGYKLTNSANEVSTPAASLPDGTVVVGASTGLMLLDAEGNVRPHPDARGALPSVDLVSGKDAVYALRIGEHGTEVVSVTATEAKPIWTEAGNWMSLGVTDTGIVVMRASDTELEQRTLALSGEELDQAVANLAEPIDYVFARTTGSEIFAMLLVQGAPQLGRIADGMFHPIAKGASSIAGPLALGSEKLVAVDGLLSRLEGDALTPMTDPDYVLCLQQNGALSYACTRTGIGALAEDGVERSLFALNSLVAPDYTRFADQGVRSECEYQWQDLRFDLVAVKMEPLPEPDAGTPAVATDAGAGAPSNPVSSGVDAGAADAGADAASGAQTRVDAGQQPVEAPAPVETSGGSSGCSVPAGRTSRGPGQAWLGAAFAVCACWLRRRRGGAIPR